jgi:ankyrin repeat protein
LLNAVGLNDLNTVKKICEEGCDVHFTTTIFPALTIAANRGSSDMVRMLLRYGADVNHAVPATDSGTVVQCSRCGRTQAAGTIKDNQYECTYCGNFTRHADASDSDHTGITALHAAVQKEGHLDVVVALLEHGVCPRALPHLFEGLVSHHRHAESSFQQLPPTDLLTQAISVLYSPLTLQLTFFTTHSYSPGRTILDTT